jgi:hypothetical protein
VFGLVGVNISYIGGPRDGESSSLVSGEPPAVPLVDDSGGRYGCGTGPTGGRRANAGSGNVCPVWSDLDPAVGGGNIYSVIGVTKTLVTACSWSRGGRDRSSTILR